MHRSPRVVLAWVVALVLALLTARVVGGDLTALHRRAHDLGPDVHVLLAQRDLPLGTTLVASDVRTVTRPASTVPSDALRAINALSGRVLLVARLRDDVLRASDLAPGARSGIDGVIPAGRRALHVVLKDGFRPPVGAVVDVLASADPTVAVSGRPLASGTAVTVAEGALVLAVDDPGTSGAGSGSAVTVLVSSSEAAAVAFAASNSQLSLALAPPEAACCTS
jgi:Flp pilus assembly protein CpaB